MRCHWMSDAMKRSLNFPQWQCLVWSIMHWKLVSSALLFTTNSEYGIFMAISLPIGLPHRNVFLSYNYEFNYYQPEHVYKYPPILMGDYQDSYLTYPTSGRGDNGRHCQNCTERRDQDGETKSNTSSNSTTESESTSTSREKRSLSLMSRSIFYSMIRDKLKRSGYPAQACLLRMICETNASQLGEVNGFLGSLIHIIFTPSSSKDEHLPDEFYQAEWDGRHHQECSSYTSICEANILDLISVPVEQTLSDIRTLSPRCKAIAVQYPAPIVGSVAD
ncbi:uncharacterized protein [Drosophila pseudoobscura]|uniref:Uncharacterized protein isoform X1 n=1 Tax=Drosophila pseudoobscura pseudoobscura TaxID=46245 RepID=A0A6I8VSG4_DROPS|nr:uncharacterized protein LOC6898275 isoform X1 [Drosophila pseudoobscura]